MTAFLLALCVGLGGAAVWLALTESGLGVAVAWLFGDSLRVRELSGRAIGPIRLTGVEIDLGGAILRAEQVVLDWDPAQWLQGRILVRPLNIESLEVQLTESNASGDAGPIALERAIVVPEAQITGIVLRSGEDRWQARSARLSVVAAGRSVRLDGLVLEAENFDARAIGTLGLNPDDPLEFGLDWEVRRSDGTELGGATRFRGTWAQVAFEHTGHAPFGWHADGELRPLGDVPQWDVAVEIEQFEPSNVHPHWPKTPVAAKLQFRGEGARARTRGEVSLPQYSDRQILLQGSFTPGEERILVEQMELSLEGLAARLHVDGALELEQTIGFDLTGAWQDVEVTAGGGNWRTPSGSFEVRGEPESYAGRFTGDLRRGGQPMSLRLGGDFTGGTTAARITDLQVESAQGSARGEIAIDWMDAPRVEAHLAGGPVDPGVIDPRLSGGVSVTADVSAVWAVDGLRYHVHVDRLEGTVNGQPVSGSGHARSAPRDGMTGAARLALGDNRLEAQGMLGERLDLSWRLEAHDLSQLVPAAGGRIEGHGRLRGTPLTPAVEIHVQGTALSWRDLALASLEVDSRFDSDTNIIEQAVFTARDVSWRGVVLEGISGEASGEVADHRFHLEAAAADGSARLQGRGGYRQQQWEGGIATGYSEIERLGRWHLADPVALQVTGRSVSLEQACLIEGGSRLCAQGNWSELRGWELSAALREVGLERLSPWLPQGLDYDGVISGDLELRGPADGPWVGQSEVWTTGVSVSRPGREEALTRISEGRAGLIAESDQVALSLLLELPEQGQLEGRLTVDRAGATRPLEGRIRGHLSDLDFLTLLVPEVLEVGGELTLDLAIGGTTESPRYAGDLALVGGSATVIELGITLEDIGLELAGDAEGLRVGASGRSAEGRIDIAGRLDWSGREVRGRITLAGERFRVADISGIRIDASPDLVVEIAGRDLELTGNVHIDQAQIAPVGLDTTTRVTISPDEVIVGEGAPEPQRWRVASRVTVTLGDIAVDAYGLRSELAGSIQIEDLPGQVARANGMLTIEKGWYKAYGQTLDIDRGRLTYRGGPVDNPELDVRAVRYLESYVVGVNVRGTLQNPLIEVFSDPPRPRQYALYLLLLGEAPVELGRAGESLSYGSPSAQFEKSLGLGAAGASAGLGTFLAPDFYIGYLEGLSLRYRITRKWTVEAERGVDTSVGLIYSIR
jgi:translocation and assembly module TamB